MRRWRCIFFISALAGAAALPLDAQIVTQAMIGHWAGNAKIAVNWTKARMLSVDLVINADGSVTGTVGDSRLVDARLRGNRGWLTGALGWKTKFIIEGKLAGPVISAEHIIRPSVSMPVNWNGDGFEGGVNTPGSTFGGANSMAFAARKLILLPAQ